MYTINILTKQTLHPIQRNIKDQIEPDVLPFLGEKKEPTIIFKHALHGILLSITIDTWDIYHNKLGTSRSWVRGALTGELATKKQEHYQYTAMLTL